MSYSQELEIISELVKNENFRISVKNSAKIGLLAGLSALVGGLIGGKKGAVAGGALGTLASLFLVDDYISVLDIIQHKMTNEQRQQLLQAVKSILMTLPSPATISTVLHDDNVKNQIISELQSAFSGAGYSLK